MRWGGGPSAATQPVPERRRWARLSLAIPVFVRGVQRLNRPRTSPAPDRSNDFLTTTGYSSTSADTFLARRSKSTSRSTTRVRDNASPFSSGRQSTSRATGAWKSLSRTLGKDSGVRPESDLRRLHEAFSYNTTNVHLRQVEGAL